MGLEVIAFTVRSFSDEGRSSDNLGIESVETIKECLDCQSQAERERKGRVEARTDKLANDKRYLRDLEIAQKQNELKNSNKHPQAKVDIAQAKADAAKGLRAEVQRREQRARS